jgi:hypothetical protein
MEVIALELTYDNMMDFMERYFEAYSTIAQDPKTTHKMRDFYSPDFQLTQYFPRHAVSDLELFLEMSSSHPGIQETLRPEYIMVDDRQKKAAVYLRADFAIKATGEVVSEMTSAHYHLKLDEKGNIKIKDLILFQAYPEPGKKGIVELYAEVFKSLK